MLDLIMICFIAGGLGAILQGMVGVGTGIVIIPLLTFILPGYGIPQDMAIHIALATSMAAIVTNSFSALISHHKRGNVQWHIFKKIILFSVIGSCLGALAASITSGRYLESIFGIFMLFTAAYMLVKESAVDITDTAPILSLPKMATGGFGIGFVASVIGTGGGILMVPFLHSLNVKMRYAVGTSTLIGLPVAIIGAVTYVVAGLSQMHSSSVTIGYVHWPAFLAISLAGIICAPIGARLATILPAKILQKAFALCMAIVGLKMLF
ncbi:hypothetical protein AQUSIP_24940 [Aquicella siphonis]|uniref:Probable membrane transporter protein n=1 Tax=Aquicella siphonis TaxID=254247 RepID=A0A5E4PLB1_9COXI|nr:sulfite exporter TauE/SafE family protein [Aquicella siphonis]VVC77167.1 hypothetical protein AQUSIP_24940 [Aquicella siphonis]